MSTTSQPGGLGFAAAKASPSVTLLAKDEHAVPELLEAVTPFGKLQIERASNLNQRADGYRPSFLECSVEDLEQIIAGLREAGACFAAWLRPVTADQLLDRLAAFADMLQVAAPSEAGIDLFVEAMGDFPGNLLARAARSVARTHKFSRLPLPADFLKAVEGELAWIKGRQAWVRTLQGKFENAHSDRTIRRLPL